MNNPCNSKLTRPGAPRSICGPWIVLLLLMLPAAVQAQFTYLITNGTVTIARYNGAGGWVTIPSTIAGLPVTSIGGFAFGNSLEQPYSPPLAGVTIPGSVVSIGDYAFAYCQDLTVAFFEGDAPSIGSDVFAGDYRNIVYYLSGTTGWGPTFGGCPTVACDPQFPCAYTTDEGTITITKYLGSGGAVTIPSTINGLPVTNIGDKAFYIGVGWPPSYILTSVTIPDSVTNIGDSAFANCWTLTNVTIGNGVTSIGGEAFASCWSLTNLTLGSGVTSIGSGAFYACTSLTSVTLPNSVISIGQWAFQACTGLTAITVDAGNSFYSSVGGALLNKSQTALIECPEGKTGAYTIPDGVTTIGEYAFGQCTHLANVTIPSSVTNIAFAAFGGCSSLTSVQIPTNVTSIADGSFANCLSLTNVTIPNSVTNIGVAAFDACTSLTGVTISSNVISIGTWAFLGCNSLNAFTVHALNPVYSSVDGVLFNKSKTLLIQCPGAKSGSYTIPDSVTALNDYAFDHCSHLIGLTIPDGVTSIGIYTFRDCMGLPAVAIPNSVSSIGEEAFVNCTSLTSVSIPNNVRSISPNVFALCTNLTSLTIPDGVTNIDRGAFASCTSLTAVYFQGNAPSLGDAYVFQGDTNATVYYLPGTTGWGTTFGGRPTALWTKVPTIQAQPQTQTTEAMSAVALSVRASSPLPLFYLWYLNSTNLLSSGTNWQLDLPNMQSSQSGAYTVVISNVLGAITSAPAMLNVIAPVERRPVPGVKLMGEAGSLLNVGYADSLSPAPNWTPLGSVSLASTSQYYFDLTLPLPAQRFYRAWQTGTPGVKPSLDLHLVPAITLTGSIGGSVRVDAINQFGPIDAWFTLDAVTLTNTSQLYFDTSAWRQPPRLYRLVQVP